MNQEGQDVKFEKQMLEMGQEYNMLTGWVVEIMDNSESPIL